MSASFQSTIIELAIVLVPIVITALLGWISPYVVRFLDTKVGHNTTLALENFARIAVAAAEQQIKTGANSDKKALALSALSAFADDHKYDTSAANLEALIEAAVFQLKQWGPISVSAAGGEGTTVNVVNEAATDPAATPAPAASADPAAEPPLDLLEPAPAPETEPDPTVSHQSSVNWS
jgi:hypothetical protein